MIIHRHDRIGSTNDEALRLAAEGAPDGTIVTARQQSAGRGRQGRQWNSPPGNFYASFLVRTARFTNFTRANAPQTGLVAALAVAGTLASIGAAIRLKWPNDVLIGQSKVAGILTEMASGAIVIGIGINVAHHPPDMPYAVTSLAAHGIDADADALLPNLAAQLDERLATWDSQGFDPIRAAWLKRGPSPGETLTARIGTGAITGAFAGLAEDGALMLMTADGMRRVVGGEVVFVHASNLRI